MKYQADNIIDLARQLSINDVETLINVFADHISIFHYPTGESWAGLGFNTCGNGTFIQINCPTSENWPNEVTK